MAAILLAIARDRSLRSQRVFRNRGNPLDCYSYLELLRRYRFPRQTLLESEIRLERPIPSSHFRLSNYNGKIFILAISNCKTVSY